MGASSSPALALPKGRTRKQIKAKRTRAEAKVLREVRAKCVERDGYCRLAGPDCDGPSTLAHLAGHRRSQTRGLPPEERHSTEWCVMLCAACHEREERGQIRLVPRNWWAGMNGPSTVVAPKSVARGAAEEPTA